MTANEIDALPIEHIEDLAEMLNQDQRDEWAYEGYSGEAYIRIANSRSQPVPPKFSLCTEAEIASNMHYQKVVDLIAEKDLPDYIKEAIIDTARTSFFEGYMKGGHAVAEHLAKQHEIAKQLAKS